MTATKVRLLRSRKEKRLDEGGRGGGRRGSSAAGFILESGWRFDRDTAQAEAAP